MYYDRKESGTTFMAPAEPPTTNSTNRYIGDEVD